MSCFPSRHYHKPSYCQFLCLLFHALPARYRYPTQDPEHRSNEMILKRSHHCCPGSESHLKPATLFTCAKPQTDRHVFLRLLAHRRPPRSLSQIQTLSLHTYASSTPRPIVEFAHTNATTLRSKQCPTAILTILAIPTLRLSALIPYVVLPAGMASQSSLTNFHFLPTSNRSSLGWSAVSLWSKSACWVRRLFLHRALVCYMLICCLNWDCSFTTAYFIDQVKQDKYFWPSDEYEHRTIFLVCFPFNCVIISLARTRLTPFRPVAALYRFMDRSRRHSQLALLCTRSEPRITEMTLLSH